MTKPTTKLLTAATLAFALPAALAGAASAEAGRTTYSIEFRYDPAVSADANYRAFENKAERECVTTGQRPLALVVQERACVADIMERLVVAMGNAQLARVHIERHGRPAPMRDFASRG
ncbi:MAG: hypothetical protein Q8R02_20360 [Hyphomonadaceae bacterium]|nr:hypothetical protein [Hyphomonadaceae bacterium]